MDRNQNRKYQTDLPSPLPWCRFASCESHPCGQEALLDRKIKAVVGQCPFLPIWHTHLSHLFLVFKSIIHDLYSLVYCKVGDMVFCLVEKCLGGCGRTSKENDVGHFLGLGGAWEIATKNQLASTECVSCSTRRLELRFVSQFHQIFLVEYWLNSESA